MPNLMSSVLKDLTQVEEMVVSAVMPVYLMASMDTVDM